MLGRVDVSVADRRRRCDHHVEEQLEHGHDRYPGEFRRDIRPARRFHPIRLAKGGSGIEEYHGIARILQIDDPERPPGSGELVRRMLLVCKADHGTVAESRQPFRRAGAARRSCRLPSDAAERRTAPECAIHGIADDVVDIERQLRVHRAEAQAVQVEFWPLVSRQFRPIAVNGVEQVGCRFLALLRLEEQRHPACQIGILDGDAGDITMLHIFERVDRGRVDPTRSGRHNHDQHGAIEGALPDHLLQGEGSALLAGFSVVQTDIDTKRLLCRPVPEA